MFNWRLIRIFRARPKLVTGIVAGLLSLIPLMAVHPAGTRAVLAWDAGSFVFILLTGISMFRRENTDISRDAKRQQEGEWSVFALTLLGAGASFAAIFLFSGSSHKADRDMYLLFVIVTLILSWLTTQVTFAYRYAHEYYTRDWKNDAPGEVERGIDFPNDDQPDYFDFIYFSFVLGMTFQVSDCDITSKKMRRLATLQGVIGFLFNTVILALSVNIAASLIS